MYEPYVLNESSQFRDVVQSLDQHGIGFVAVVDVRGLLVGIVTDGDVRRAVLKGRYSLDELINRTPETVLHDTTKREMIARLKYLHRRHLPLIDDEGMFKGVFFLDDVDLVSKKNSVVIMAGGLGSRMGELTKETPKSMLQVGKKPMLQHLIEMFSDHGFNKFKICVNYKKETIKEFFKCGKELGVQIEYIEEDRRLGTAGALSLLGSVPDQPFFVINGDILTTLDFDDLLEFHHSKISSATMCVRKFNYQIPYGVVKTDEVGLINAIEEKPVTSFNVNAGIYILNPDVLRYVPIGTFFDMPSLFETLIAEGHRTTVFQLSDYWLDIGRIEDFKKANADLTF